MTDSDYSQEVNKMNEHDISNDHSFTTKHLSQVICGFESSLNIPTLTKMLHVQSGSADDLNSTGEYSGH